MRTFNIKVLTATMIVVSLVFFSSCKKDLKTFVKEQFPEIDSTSGNLLIDGELAVPVLNTEFSLENFVPENDSSLWAEVGEDNIMHLRMYFKNVLTIGVKDIWSDWTPGSNSVPIAETTLRLSKESLKIYEHALQGKLFFRNPAFKFIIKNEIPVNTYFKIDSLVLHSGGYSNSDSAVATPVDESINTPGTNGGITEIIIDSSNVSNLATVFSPVPKFVSGQITIGNSESEDVVLTGNEKTSVALDIDLPLDARLDAIVLGDTSKFEMIKDEDNIEEIKDVTIKIVLTNDFPVKGLTEVIFAKTNTDNSLTTVLELFDTPWEFNSSEIDDESGETIASVESMITKTLSQDDVKKLKDQEADKIIIKSTLNSQNSENDKYIKILGRYRLGIKMGLKVSYAGTAQVNQ